MEWTNEQKKNTLNLVTIHSLIFVDIHLAYENVQSHHYAFCISWLQKLQAKLTKRWGCVVFFFAIFMTECEHFLCSCLSWQTNMNVLISMGTRLLKIKYPK